MVVTLPNREIPTPSAGKHPLGVVAGRTGHVDAGRALRAECRETDRAQDLRARHQGADGQARAGVGGR